MNERYFILVPAAGGGTRMKTECPKQYLLIQSHPVLWHTLNALNSVPQIHEIHLILAPDDVWFYRFDWNFSKLVIHFCGGRSRAQSVQNGLRLLPTQPNDWILVHDAARCCITSTLISQLINTLTTNEIGGLLALPLPDTLKQADEANQHVLNTLPRSRLWLAQTPQMFRASILNHALLEAEKQNLLDTTITDEASAVEALGLHPFLIEGSSENIKVTYPKDLQLADAILHKRKEKLL